MDQRYRYDGDETDVGALGDDNHQVGWTTFRDDQQALLNHLQIQRPCHIVASCIVAWCTSKVKKSDFIATHWSDTAYH